MTTVSAVIQRLLFAFLKNLEQLFQFLFVLQVLGYFDDGVSLAFGIEVKPNKGGNGDTDARQNPEKWDENFCLILHGFVQM